MGWKGKLIDSGATAVAIGYGKFNDGVYLNSQQVWGAVNQAVDAAASDVYAGLAMDSGKAANEAGDASQKRDDV